MRRAALAQGHFLIEFLVATAIALLIGLVLISVYLTVGRGLAILTMRSGVTGGLRNAVEQMGRDIDQAQEAPATCPGGFGVSGTTLLLTQVGVTDCVVYQCAGACTLASPGILQRLTVSSGGATTQTRIIANDVILLAFSRLDLDATPATIEQVAFSLGVRPKMPQYQQYPLAGKLRVTFKLRN